jgi:hypothetical protein
MIHKEKKKRTVSLFGIIAFLCSVLALFNIHASNNIRSNGEETAQHKNMIQFSKNQKEIVYYSDLRPDRSGTAILHMMYSFAYAYAKKATYGGACGNSTYIQDHRDLLNGIGLGNVLPIACPMNNSSETIVRKIKGATPEHVKQKWKALGPASDGWKDYLRSHVRFDYDEGYNHPLIVVHIRRGDVDPCCYRDRYLPNWYYANFLDQYKTEHPNATIRIFSESKSFEPLDTLAKNYGAQLHLDSDLADVWKAMMLADVLITSRSSFSAIPQLISINPNPWHNNAYMTSEPILKQRVDAEIDGLRKKCTMEHILPCQKDFFKGG